MQFSKRSIVVASTLLASTFIWGQLPPNTGRKSLLVRMSFASAWINDFGDRDLPQICLSVDEDGHYEMRRLTRTIDSEQHQGSPGAKLLPGTPHIELVQGTLPPSEVMTLRKFLGNREFMRLGASGPRILRNGGETFVAEVPRETGVQRVVMSDADGANPFPRSANKIVNWLQHFTAEGAEPLDVSAQDICPSVALKQVNPATASVHPNPSPGACIRH
jgi:hypothetical protein